MNLSSSFYVCMYACPSYLGRCACVHNICVMTFTSATRYQHCPVKILVLRVKWHRNFPAKADWVKLLALNMQVMWVWLWLALSIHEYQSSRYILHLTSYMWVFWYSLHVINPVSQARPSSGLREYYYQPALYWRKALICTMCTPSNIGLMNKAWLAKTIQTQAQYHSVK